MRDKLEVARDSMRHANPEGDLAVVPAREKPLGPGRAGHGRRDESWARTGVVDASLSLLDERRR